MRTIHLKYALLGAALAIMLQLFLYYNWEMFLQSVPGYQWAIVSGVAPSPHVLASPLSMNVGLIFFLAASILVAALTQRRVRDVALAMAFGVTVAEILLAVVFMGFPSNLWPFTLAAVIVYSCLPVIVGSAIGWLFTRISPNR